MFCKRGNICYNIGESKGKNGTSNVDPADPLTHIYIGAEYIGTEHIEPDKIRTTQYFFILSRGKCKKYEWEEETK